MIRPSVLVLGLFGLIAVVDRPASAQGPKQHMDLVRGLRNNGLPDLALEYLDDLKKRNPPPQIAILLPLEYARTWLELATQEPEEGKRSALIAQARRELDVFINANPKHPQVLQANVELARLISLQGKVTLSKARRLEEGPTKKAEMTKARDELTKASVKYAATVGLLDAQLKALENDKSPAAEVQRQELTQFRLRSLIDQGITLFDMGETFASEESDDFIKRADQFKAAKKIFEKVMYLDDKEPLCWVARAWAAESDYKMGETDNSARAFTELLARRLSTPAAAAGIRIARYFGIFHPLDNKEKLDLRGKLVKGEKDAADWLRDYPAYRKTAEGIGARYYLALAKLELGKSGILRDKDNKVTGMTTTAKAQFEDAQRLFKELTDSENEFTERANRFRSQILVTIADAEGHGDAPDPATLGTFERCYLMAQVQAARFAQFKLAKLAPPKTEAPPEKEPDPKDPKKNLKKDLKKEPKKETTPVVVDPKALQAEIEKEEHRRYTNAVKYLEYALQLVTPRDSVRDVFSAQLFLVRCYYQLKMYPQAAVLAEYIARTNPKMNQAPLAGIFAVDSYNNSLRAARQKGDVPPQNAEADMSRLRGAAEFMVEKFPTEDVTDQARHTLAFFLFNRDKKYLEAWKAYSEIKPSYPAVQPARLELSYAMLSLVIPSDERDPKKQTQMIGDRIKDYSSKQGGEIWPRTISLLEGTPSPDEDCITADALSYLESRSQLARMYQMEKKFDKAQAEADSILKAVGKFANLSAQQKTNQTHTAQNLALNAIRGAAYAEFEKNNYPRVAELLDPKIPEIQKSFAEAAKEELTIPLKQLRQTQRQILILALQSAVQDQKIDRAGEFIDLLDQSDKSSGSTDGSLSILQSLVTNVHNQIEDLEADGKKAEAVSLKKGFSALLEKIAAAKGDKMPTALKMVIAKGYISVDNFLKAAELLDAIRKLPAPPKPQPLSKEPTDDEKAKFDQLNGPYKAHESLQNQAQYLMARSYRKAGDAAAKEPDRITEYNKALAALTEMIGTPGKGGVIPKDKRGRGFGSLEIRKEKASVLEDIAKTTSAPAKSKKWVEAVQEWVGISKSFTPELPALPDLLTPMDKAKYKTPEERAKRQAEIENQLTPEQRAKRATDMAAVAAKRNTYFELWFEAKRCSVKAYMDIGVAATKGSQDDYVEKFTKFANDLNEFQSKNKDLPSTVKEKIQKLINETPLLKQEYKKVVSGK